MSNKYLYIFIAILIIYSAWEVNRLNNKIDELNNLPEQINITHVTVWDSVTVRDTVTVWLPTSLDNPSYLDDIICDPVDSSLSRDLVYNSSFSDSLLNIKVNTSINRFSFLANTEVSYKFIKPLVVVNKLDSLIIERDRVIKQIKADPSGLFLGAMVSNNGIGPSAAYTNKGGASFGYSYDLVNDAHMLTFRHKIVLPKIKFNLF